jgi:hypothetical protein
MASGVSVGEVIIVTAAGLAIVGAVVAAVGIARRWWRATIGLQRDTSRKFDQLARGMYRDYLIELFGQPVLHEQQEDGRTVLRWRFRHAWCSALMVNNAVAAYSITTTSRRFAYRTRRLSWGTLNVSLGRSPFAAAGDPFFGSVEWAIGARRVRYREMHYLGNPGMYQYYVLSSNDAGRLPAQTPPSSGGRFGEFAKTGPDSIPLPQPPDLDALSTYRSQTSPNTITVVAGDDLANTARLVEVDWDGVRLFDRPMATSFRIKLRMLRWRVGRRLGRGD